MTRCPDAAQAEPPTRPTETELMERYAFYWWLKHICAHPWDAPSTHHLEVALDALHQWPDEPSLAWSSWA